MFWWNVFINWDDDDVPQDHCFHRYAPLLKVSLSSISSPMVKYHYHYPSKESLKMSAVLTQHTNREPISHFANDKPLPHFSETLECCLNKGHALQCSWSHLNLRSVQNVCNAVPLPFKTVTNCKILNRLCGGPSANYRCKTLQIKSSKIHRKVTHRRERWKCCGYASRRLLRRL